MAGHETTAKALTWTQWLLHQHPEILARVRADGTGWLAVQEGMRLYPPVWIISRVCVADDQMDGYDIPAGSLVIISPYAMHRRPDVYPDPEKFDPARFDGPAAA